MTSTAQTPPRPRRRPTADVVPIDQARGPMPHDPDMEQWVLASWLSSSPGARDRVAQFTSKGGRPETFYSKQRGNVCRVILDLLESSETVDAMVVYREAVARGLEVPPLDEMLRWTAEALSTDTEHYAGPLIEFEHRRAIKVKARAMDRAADAGDRVGLAEAFENLSAEDDAGALRIPTGSGRWYITAAGNLARAETVHGEQRLTAVAELPDVAGVMKYEDIADQSGALELVYRLSYGTGSREILVPYDRLADASAYGGAPSPPPPDSKIMGAYAAAIMERARGLEVVDATPRWFDGRPTLPPAGCAPFTYGMVRGDEDEARATWARIGEVAAANPKVALVMGAIAGGMYVEPMGRETFFAHMSPEPRKGKTSAQKVAAAMLGNPAKGKALATFDVSAIGLTRQLGRLNYLPVVLNELGASKMTPAQLEHTVFAVTDGIRTVATQRGRGTVTALPYSGVIVSSGNRSLATVTDNPGLPARVVEIPTPITDTPDAAIELKRLAAQSYGWPLVWLMATSDTERMAELVADAETALEARSGGTIGTIAEHLALCIAGATLFGELTGAPGLGRAAETAAGEVLEHSRVLLADTGEIPGERLLEAIRAAMAARPYAFPRWSKGEDLSHREPVREREGIDFGWEDPDRLPPSLQAAGRAGKAGADREAVEAGEMPSEGGHGPVLILSSAIDRIARDAGILERRPALVGLRNSGHLIVNGGESDGRLRGDVRIKGLGRVHGYLFAFDTDAYRCEVENTGDNGDTSPVAPKLPGQRGQKVSPVDRGQTPARKSVPGGPGTLLDDEKSRLTRDDATATDELRPVSPVSPVFSTSHPPIEVEPPAGLVDLARRLGALSDDAASRIADAMDAAGWDSATDLANLEPVQIDQVAQWVTEAEEMATAAPTAELAPTTPALAHDAPTAPREAPTAAMALDVDGSGGLVVIGPESAEPVDQVPTCTGDLLDLAEGMTQTLWVEARALGALGLTEPPAKGDPFSAAPGWVVNVNAADRRVRGHREGQRGTVRIMWAATDQGPFAELPDAGSRVAALELFAAASRMPWQGSGGATFESILRVSHRTDGHRVSDLGPSIEPVGLVDLKTAGVPKAHGEKDLAWDRRPDDAPGQYAHAFDRAGSYMAGMGEAAFGLGEPAHLVDPHRFDPKERRPGWWCIRPCVEGYPAGIPYLASSTGRLPAESTRSHWVTTPTARFLAKDLGLEVNVVHAWVWPTSEAYFRTVRKHLGTARSALVATRGTPEGEVAYSASKRVYSEGLNNLRAQYHADALEELPGGLVRGPELWRPNVHTQVVALHRANMTRSIRKVGTASGVWPVATLRIDEWAYLTDEPDPLTFAATIGLPIGTDLGQWKPSRSAPVGRLPIDDYRPGRIHSHLRKALAEKSDS